MCVCVCVCVQKKEKKLIKLVTSAKLLKEPSLQSIFKNDFKLDMTHGKNEMFIYTLYIKCVCVCDHLWCLNINFVGKSRGVLRLMIY